MVLSNLAQKIICITCLFISTVLFFTGIFLLPDAAESTPDEADKKLYIILIISFTGFLFWCISFIMYKESVNQNV